MICGYYGFANAGDEAMLMAVIEALDDIKPDLDITVLSGNPKETAKRHGVKAVHRFNILAVFLNMLKSDILISGGGSLLQDVTSRRSIFYYLGIMQMAKILGKPVMLYGQGIGPVNGGWARRLTSYVCKQVDMIAVRDRKSVEALAELGIKEKEVFLTADPVMAMNPVDKYAGRMILREYGMEGSRPLFGIAAREWQSLSGFKKVLAEVSDRLIREYGARVLFLPLQYPDELAAYPDDLATSNEIVALMKEKENVAVVSQRCSINDFLSIVGNMDLLISIRLHALIFGAVMKVPVLGISYDPKIDGFLEEIKARPVARLDEVTADAVMKRVDEVMADPRFTKEQNEYLDKLRDGALKNAELAVCLLEGKTPEVCRESFKE